MTQDKDPMGAAIADFWRNGTAGRLRVFSPGFDEDEIPVETLFREWDEMPALEQRALTEARGRILDVGAGAGCHTLALSDMDKDATAIDISPLSVATMQQRGLEARLEDFWCVGERYDTVLLLMNGLGIIGTCSALPRFFAHLDAILADGGQVLLESTDVRYLYETEEGEYDFDGLAETPDAATDQRYYGEMDYTMQYKRTRGTEFAWLYLDPNSLIKAAAAHGFQCDILLYGPDYNYLARLSRKDR